ncbi:MAG: DNA adenine methylase, partial [Oscillospiraceae bacterium]|nr:DNA adenine methylase [Oscillospiraceae bacterium]
MTRIPSPLNYTGGKFRLLPQILPHFPGGIDTFVDLFCGGCNVGLNVPAGEVQFIDTNPQLVHLYRAFQTLGRDIVFEQVNKLIDDYGLSRSDEHGYEYYGCESSGGLGAFNRAAFLRLRADFNNSPSRPRPLPQRLEPGYTQLTLDDTIFPDPGLIFLSGANSDYILLYALILFAFNNQIRFNLRGEFNLPVGKRDFNTNMQGKLQGFFDRLAEGNYSFLHQDFREFDPTTLTKNSLVYCDPPYLITCATYNEQGGWNETDERDLLAFLDRLDRQGIRFALSNVLSSKGRENHLLQTWADRYRVIPLEHHYANANYQRKARKIPTEE